MVYAFAVSAVIVAGAAIVVLWSRHHKRHPLNPLVSSSGVVDSPLNPNGSVFVHGELWLACSDTGNLIPAKTPVTVVGVKDHLLLVVRS